MNELDEILPVIQEDRAAAAAMLRAYPVSDDEDQAVRLQVAHQVENGEMDASVRVQAFARHRIGHRPEEMSRKEEITIDMTEEEFLHVARRAHDLDITFNQMMEIIIRKAIDEASISQNSDNP